MRSMVRLTLHRKFRESNSAVYMTLGAKARTMHKTNNAGCQHCSSAHVGEICLGLLLLDRRLK